MTAETVKLSNLQYEAPPSNIRKLLRTGSSTGSNLVRGTVLYSPEQAHIDWDNAPGGSSRSLMDWKGT